MKIFKKKNKLLQIMNNDNVYTNKPFLITSKPSFIGVKFYSPGQAVAGEE